MPTKKVYPARRKTETHWWMVTVDFPAMNAARRFLVQAQDETEARHKFLSTNARALLEGEMGLMGPQCALTYTELPDRDVIEIPTKQYN